MKTLVVYYSGTGNAKFVAEKIAQELGADIDEVIDEKNRRGLIGFLTRGYDATRGKKTRIAEAKKNPKEFDMVVVGTPVWNGRPSPAIRTYLSNNDLSGKKVAIFCTNEGSGGAKAIARTKVLIANGDFTEHLVVSNAIKNNADTEDKISEWCSKLKLL
jgi:flavodoxin